MTTRRASTARTCWSWTSTRWTQDRSRGFPRWASTATPTWTPAGEPRRPASTSWYRGREWPARRPRWWRGRWPDEDRRRDRRVERHRRGYGPPAGGRRLAGAPGRAPGGPARGRRGRARGRLLRRRRPDGPRCAATDRGRREGAPRRPP